MPHAPPAVRPMGSPARRALDAALSEAEWSATIIGTTQVPGVARTLGWMCKHVHDSRKEVVGRDGTRQLVGDRDAAGLLDWLLIRDRVIFLELKTSKGRLRPEQTEVFEALLDAGAEAYIWRPEHFDEAVRVLTDRVRP